MIMVVGLLVPACVGSYEVRAQTVSERERKNGRESYASFGDTRKPDKKRRKREREETVRVS